MVWPTRFRKLDNNNALGRKIRGTALGQSEKAASIVISLSTKSVSTVTNGFYTIALTLYLHLVQKSFFRCSPLVGRVEGPVRFK